MKQKLLATESLKAIPKFHQMFLDILKVPFFFAGLLNEGVLRFVLSKGIMERPNNCSDFLHELMNSCWHWRPNDRPTFWDIVERLEEHVDPDFKMVCFFEPYGKLSCPSN